MCKLECHLRVGVIIMVFCVSMLVVKWLGLGIEQVKLNEPASPNRHDKYSQSSNELFGYPRVPQAVSNTPGPWQAGHKSQKLAVSIPGNVLGNIAETCVLLPCKKSGSMENSWELFFSAVWRHVNKIYFPGIFCNVPRKLFKNSQERFQVAVFKQEYGWDFSVENIRA